MPFLNGPFHESLQNSCLYEMYYSFDFTSQFSVSFFFPLLNIYNFLSQKKPLGLIKYIYMYPLLTKTLKNDDKMLV